MYTIAKILLLLFMTTGLQAPQASDPSPQLSDALIWEVQGPGLAAPSYLFADPNIYSPEEGHRIPALERILAETHGLIFMTEKSKSTEHAQIGYTLLNPEGSLKDHLSEKEWHAIETELKDKYPMPMDVLDLLQPMFVYCVLEEAIPKDALQTPDLQDSLLQTAEQTELPIDYLFSNLESVRSLFGGDQIPAQIAALKELSRHKKDYLKFHQQFEESLRKGDYGDAWGKALRYYQHNSARSYVLDRYQAQNEAAAQNLIEKFKTRDQLAVLHYPMMIGEAGIPNQLRQLGYTVRPVSH